MNSAGFRTPAPERGNVWRIGDLPARRGAEPLGARCLSAAVFMVRDDRRI
jgi:hypothetical protein